MGIKSFVQGSAFGREAKIVEIEIRIPNVEREFGGKLT